LLNLGSELDHRFLAAPSDWARGEPQPESRIRCRHGARQQADDIHIPPYGKPRIGFRFRRRGFDLPAGSHFEFVFPSLPTTLAVCLTAGNPANATGLAFGLAPTTLSTAPALPTGSGNPADPSIRAIGPQTGATNGAYSLKNGAAVVVTGALPTCTIPVNTAVPAFACGDA